MNAADWSFDRDGVISLRGEWEFYDHVLLGPQDFQANQAEWINKSISSKCRAAGRKRREYPMGKGTERALFDYE